MNGFVYMYFIRITHFECDDETGEWSDWEEYVKDFQSSVATNTIYRRYDKNRVIMHTTKNPEVAIGFSIPEEAYAMAAFTRLYLLDGEEDMETFEVDVWKRAIPTYMSCEECKSRMNVLTKDCYECGANIDDKYKEKVRKEIEQAKKAEENMRRYEVKR